VLENSLTLLKRLFIGGILSVGLMPGMAQAKWIKVSVTGVGVSPANPVQLDFVLWNFNTATPNVWNQTGPLYGSGYGPAPLYGYGTGVSNSSPQTLQGPFVPQYTPGTFGNTFALNNDGSGFEIDLTSSSTIPYLVKGFGGGAGTDTVKSIQVLGNLTGFSSSSTPNVVDFLDTAISGTGSFSCAACTGTIDFTNEGVFTFNWTNAQFDEIESVPTPLPIFGALSAFAFSRKLRKRINIQKIETLG
jgi:hypothetical protein